MKSIVRGGGLVIGAALLLSGCGSFDGKREGGPAAGPTPAPASDMVSDTPVKVGDPYTIGGATYTPADIPDYDDVGYASWYGEELAGKPTANGEIFNPGGISAAHKTLPLPSYVEVTALDTGRTILVRVNDRGPMVGDRLIDLSRGAAEQLGISGGTAAVRVRRTNPPMAERVQLRAGRPVPERIATPESLLAILRNKLKAMPAPKAVVVTAPAAPIAAPKPATAGGSYAVQVGAFSSEANANAAAKSVGGSVVKAGKLWRVRLGPFASDADAKAALAKAKAKGFRDAAVVHDR